MDDYISRAAIIRAVEGNPFVTDSVKSFVRCSARNIPTADVRPVVKGKWLPAYTQPDGGTVYCFSCCSECGHKMATNPNYCPNCGADMRGEENG